VNKMRLRMAMEVVGVVAVAGSMLLVAYQIQQANRIAQATILYEIVRDINEYNSIGASDPAFAGLLVQLSGDQSELSQIQAQQAKSLAFRFLNIWVVQEVAFRNGLYTDDLFELTKADVINVLSAYPKLRPFMATAMQSRPGYADYEALQPIIEQ